MKNNTSTTRFLQLSLAGVVVLCLLVFASLFRYSDKETRKTIEEVGSIYMTGMSERITMHFDTTIDYRIAQLQSIVDTYPPDSHATAILREQLINGGRARNFVYLGLYAPDTALKLADYVVTEAGFGADLGAEKFLDIKCRAAGLDPSAVVIVATVKALKYNGGVAKADLGQEDLAALEKGIANLEKHMENLQKYGVPVVVTLNHFMTDTQAEIDFVKEFCQKRNCRFALSQVWEKGGEGGVELAEKLLETLAQEESHFHVLYEDEVSLEDKIRTVAGEIYGAGSVAFSPAAKKQLQRLTELGFGGFPVCMAKNQYSLSDDPKLLGRPEGFELTVREAYVSAGAGFVVALTGDVVTMPGLSKKPAAYGIDVSEDGVITGLF